MALVEIFAAVCQNCKRGTIVGEVPARPQGGPAPATICPFCRKQDPGWDVWEIKGTAFADVPSGRLAQVPAPQAPSQNGPAGQGRGVPQGQQWPPGYQGPGSRR